jgi:hypothetical protein
MVRLTHYLKASTLVKSAYVICGKDKSNVHRGISKRVEDQVGNEAILADRHHQGYISTSNGYVFTW